MTTAQSEVCRVTVVSPGGRMDFAVPLAVPVAGLIPVLVRRMTDRAGANDAQAWVLQRLGEAPLDPTGTPESLDWRDGDEFHLRPAVDRLPEMDFDDVADGMAAAIGQHRARWRPQFNRWLFLGLSIAAMSLVVSLLLVDAVRVEATIGALLIGAALVAGSIVSGLQGRGHVLVLLLGLAGCVFSGVGGAVSPAGAMSAVQLRSGSVLVAGLAVVVAATILLLARAIGKADWPHVPFAVAVAAGVLAVVSQWLYLVVALTPTQTAGVLSAALLFLLLVSPRLAIRLARLRGPQLPRNAEELQQDIDPIPADEIAGRTAFADDLLTTVAVSAAIGYAAAMPFLLAGGVFGLVLAGLVASAALLRARGLLRAWQRIPLIVAGSLGVGVIAVALATALGTEVTDVVFGVACLLVVSLLFAMERPPSRRLMPIWGRFADWAETLTTVAMVPVLLQLFGVYAWALELTK